MKALSVVALALLGLTACEPAAPPEDRHAALVRVVEIRHGRLQHELSFYGVLQPVSRARLAFQSSGVLRSRPVSLGQRVQEGEVLATLDNPELGPGERAGAARLQEYLSQRDQAERDLHRLRSLAASGAVGEEQLEQKSTELASLEAAVLRAKADLTGSRQRLTDATLVAPFDGVISALSAEPGEYLAAGQPLMSIGGLDAVEVRLLLPAALVAELGIGAGLKVRLPQLGGRETSGVVSELSTIGEVETGLFPVVVEVALDPSISGLRAGMQAQVLVDYADVAGLIVPLRAIVDPVGGAPAIFTVAEGRAQRHEVDILAIANGEVAVAMADGGADPGDLVVVAGTRSLTAGQQVSVLR
ncbi:MAG: efflux RND transporter periplasmic adaptor subunit [Xanthomonadales bacterium]|nr:efflux RND transporter periplasmic adaptor subunit [Xanthomonadales bacterium]